VRGRRSDADFEQIENADGHAGSKIRAESRYSTLLLKRTILGTMMLILYQRDDCHLCDLALEVLAQAKTPDFSSVFIDDDAALEARYGARVPVLRDATTDRELDWPFDAAALARFLGS
jgi:Glutaredoxin-like domain (DUF836)